MTIAPPTVDARDVADDLGRPADRRAAARAVYLASVEAGKPLTGAELGRRFGRTDRWGRMEISRFKRELDTGSGNGRQPGARGRNLAGPQQNGGSPHLNSSVAPAERKSSGSDLHASTERAAGERAGSIGSAGTRLEPPSSRQPEANDAPDETSPPSWLDPLVTLAVAVVCAAASYGHMHHVALLAGEPLWIARAWPVTVDGLVLAALRRGREGRLWLALGIAVSMAANVLAQFPELAASAGPFVSAWPPVALYGTHRLLDGARRRPAVAGSPVG
jgi:hypothetical protein